MQDHEGSRVSFVVEPGAAGPGPVLHVTGELDEPGAAELADAVRAQLATSPAALVLDLAGTSYLNSSGARQLVVLTREATAAGTALRVECPRGNRAVWRVVDLLQLTAVVPVTEPDPAPAVDGRHP